MTNEEQSFGTFLATETSCPKESNLILRSKQQTRTSLLLCPICHDEGEPSNFVRLPCHHSIHPKCIEKWLHGGVDGLHYQCYSANVDCPECRGSLKHHCGCAFMGPWLERRGSWLDPRLRDYPCFHCANNYIEWDKLISVVVGEDEKVEFGGGYQTIRLTFRVGNRFTSGKVYFNKTNCNMWGYKIDYKYLHSWDPTCIVAIFELYYSSTTHPLPFGLLPVRDLWQQYGFAPFLHSRLPAAIKRGRRRTNVGNVPIVVGSGQAFMYETMSEVIPNETIRQNGGVGSELREQQTVGLINTNEDQPSSNEATNEDHTDADERAVTHLPESENDFGAEHWEQSFR